MTFRSPASLQRSASSMATRIAWAASGAGMIPSARANGQRRLEGGVLVDGHRLDDLVVVELADERAPCRGSAARRRGSAPG